MESLISSTVPDPREFGRRVQTLRWLAGAMSEKELGVAVGKSQTWVAWIEYRREQKKPTSVRLDIADQLARAFADRGLLPADPMPVYTFLLGGPPPDLFGALHYPDPPPALTVLEGRKVRPAPSVAASQTDIPYLQTSYPDLRRRAS